MREQKREGEVFNTSGYGLLDLAGRRLKLLFQYQGRRALMSKSILLFV